MIDQWYYYCSKKKKRQNIVSKLRVWILETCKPALRLSSCIYFLFPKKYPHSLLLTNVLWSCIWLKILVLRFTMHFWFFSSIYWKIQSNIYHLFLVVSLTTGFQCNVPSCFNKQSPNKWRSRKYWVNVANYKHLFCVKKCLHSYFNLQTAWFA